MQQNDSNDQNYQVALSPHTVTDYAARSSLYAGEAALFAKYDRVIRNARILDIGVGGGRTSLFLIPNSRSYTAIDYSAPMIAAAKERLPFCKEAFFVGDARRLSKQFAGPFDFVLFAFGGIDSVDHDGRQLILAEVHRVLADDGLFFFSTHSLHAFPFSEPDVQARNAHHNPAELRQRGWALLTDRRADVVLHYVYPDFQIRQLAEAGFEVLDILDMQGDAFDVLRPSRDWLLSFMCRKREARQF